MKKLFLQSLMLILVLFFLICSVSASTINSESYSIEMVNSGLQTSAITSESYQADIALDYSGTGYAESENYMMSIGFFNSSSITIVETSTPAETEQTEESSSGGHNQKKNVTECYYNWSCSSWSFCSEGKQNRDCINLGTCNGTYGKPAEEKVCVEELPNTNVSRNISEEIKNDSEKDGEVIEEEQKNDFELAKYLVGIVIAVLIGQIFGYRLFYKKYSFEGGIKKFPLMIMLLVVGGSIVLYGAFSFTTGRVVEGIKTNSYGELIWLPILIILSLTIFFIVKSLLKRKKPIRDNGLSRTIGLEVYSSNGEKIGKIEEIYLEEEKSKVYGWLIKTDGKFVKKIKHKKILIRQKHVESIKEVMIVNLGLENKDEQNL